MHWLIQTLARLTALVGGVVLVALIVMTTLSIIGRSLNKFLHNDFFDESLVGFSQWVLDLGVGEINGNYEVLEAGVAFAIFSFLPICQFYGAHATVDVFTSALPAKVTRWIAAFWEVVLALTVALIVWRLFEGTLSHFKRGGTTTFLQFPLWWPYTLCCIAGMVAVITAVYCAVIRVGEALSNRSILPSEHGDA